MYALAWLTFASLLEQITLCYSSQSRSERSFRGVESFQKILEGVNIAGQLLRYVMRRDAFSCLCNSFCNERLGVSS